MWWLAAGLGLGASYFALGLGTDLAPEPAATSSSPRRTERAAPRRPRSALQRQLDALVSQGGRPLGLGSLLTAIEADPTPPERDPRWRELCERLADEIERSSLEPAMDLLVSEQRPRARRALFSAYALLALSERCERLPAAARQTLTNHFIDGWPGLEEGQRPEVEQALRKLAGDDVADIMNGKGLAADDATQGARERERALEESSRLLTPLARGEAPP